MNKLRSWCLLAFIFTAHEATAQLVTLTGKVTDKQTGGTLPGASVRSGNYGTSTNINGNFYLVIDKDIARQKGIAISFIGYQKVTVPFNGESYQISLKSLDNRLREVIISGKGETILAKAIHKIPENYPAKNFMMNGKLLMMHTAKDSTGYQFY
jgi:hypothetical protein